MNAAEPTPRVLLPAGDPFAVLVALPAAMAVAGQLGALLEAVHAASGPLGTGGARVLLGLDEGEAASVALSVAMGNPVDVILGAAAHEAVVLVVMATRGLHSSTPESSVTRSVVNRINRPLLLVRSEPGGRDPRTATQLRRLLLPVDGTPTTARALRSVTKLAHRLGAHLDLLYVAGHDDREAEPGCMSAPRYVDQPHHEWPSWRGEVVDRLCRVLVRCPEEVPVEMFLASGETGAEIVKFAAEHDEDVVVLVRRNELRSGHGRTLWHILQHSPVPLMLLVGQYERWEPTGVSSQTTPTHGRP